jgi:hypothetical protein
MPAASNAHTRTPYMHATAASRPAPLARTHATDPLRRECTHSGPCRRKEWPAEPVGMLMWPLAEPVGMLGLTDSVLHGPRRIAASGARTARGKKPPVVTRERISKAPATHTNVRGRMARTGNKPFRRP